MNVGKLSLWVLVVVGVMRSAAAPAAENPTAPAPGDLRAVGKIEFPISAAAEVRPEFERGKGTGQWHGGPIAAIIDTVGDYALIMALRRGLPTINFRVDYLRPAIKTALITTATVRRNGKSVGVVDVDVFNEQKALLAIGRATYSTLS